MSTKFQAGISGNPKGRPKGIRDRRLQWRDTLRAEVPALLARLVELAKGGDLTAMKIVLDRVAPALRSQAEAVDLPTLASALSLTDKARAVLAAVADGRISPDAAGDVLSGLGAVAKIVETDELAARVAALESKAND